MKLLNFYLLLAISILILACHKDDDGHSHGEGTSNESYMEAAHCENLNPTYTNEVKAIIDASCATSGCHDATTAAHGVQLDTYANVTANFDAHAFLCSIHHGADCIHMPFNGDKLSESEIELITCWAKGGFTE